MFDYLRNLTKSSDEKRQEMLTAYVDGELSPRDSQQFEAMMAQDRSLRAEVDAQIVLQQQMQFAARRRSPRNFTLDAAVYGAPDPQPLFRLYPVLQTATVLAALMLFLVFGLDLFGGGQADFAASETAAVVEVTRVVTETLADDADTADEALTELAVPVEEAELGEALPAPADGASAAAPAQEQSFGLVEGTPLPVPTQSASPRGQELELESRAETADLVEPTASPDAAANASGMADEATDDLDAVDEEASQAAKFEQTSVPAPSPWRVWQIVLFALFISLLLATLVVRQRIR